MDDNNTSSGSLYKSTSFSEEDDDLNTNIIAHRMNEYEEIFLSKTPHRILMWSGAQFVRDMRYDRWSSSNMLWTILDG